MRRVPCLQQGIPITPRVHRCFPAFAKTEGAQHFLKKNKAGHCNSTMGSGNSQRKRTFAREPARRSSEMEC